MNEHNLPDNKILPACYDHHAGYYWVQDAGGEYIQVNDRNLRLRLKQAGLISQPPFGKPVSQLDEAVLHIQNTMAVAYAGPLAGYSKGLYKISGQKILVTSSPALIEPRKGNWPVLAEFVSNLLGHQQPYFFGWMKVAVECLRTGKRAPGQALVLAGEAASGKSLLQNLITIMLGGRSEKPYRYMAEKTTFNSELFRAEHLMIEDEPASTDLRTRKRFGAQIKIFTVNLTQSCHAKGRPAINLTPLWRVSITLNNEPESLLILPPLDESLDDKIILLKGERHPMPMPTKTLAEQEAFWGTLISELPAFIDFLLNWEIPPPLKSDRFGIKHYHHPEIRAAIDTLAPEQRMLELFDSVFFVPATIPWEGTATELQRQLELWYPREARMLFNFSTAAGTNLGRLAKSDPKRVEKIGTGQGNRWRIQPPVK